MVVLAGATGYLYLSKKYNITFNSAVMWNIPSISDLYDRSSEFERSYPKIIAGNVEPAGIWMNRLVSDKADELKALGINTVTIMPYYKYSQGSPELKNPGVVALGDDEESIRALYIWQIVQAKKQGLAVFLTPNFIGRSGQIFDVPLEKFLEDANRIAMEWAKIAEDFNVEYFSPQGEIDLVISLNYFGDDWQKRHEAIKVSNKWLGSILPGLRKIFSGKLAYKYTLESELLDASGYDFVAVDVGPWNEKTIDEFRENMRRRFEIARTNADRAEANWLVAEFWAPHGANSFGVPSGIDINLYGEKIKQEDLYAVVIDEYKKVSFYKSFKPTAKSAAGFMFNSFLMPGTDIAGRPAESLIKKFFQDIHNSNP